MDAIISEIKNRCYLFRSSRIDDNYENDNDMETKWLHFQKTYNILNENVMKKFFNEMN